MVLQLQGGLGNLDEIVITTTFESSKVAVLPDDMTLAHDTPPVVYLTISM